MPDHRLIDGTLITDSAGITARCECGWVSGGYFSSLLASAAFAHHKAWERDNQTSGDTVSENAKLGITP